MTQITNNYEHGKRQWKAVAAAVGLLLGAMVAGQAAPAAADVPGYDIITETERDDSPVISGQPDTVASTLTATADCPNGQVLVGVGGSTSGANWTSQPGQPGGANLGGSTGLEYIKPDLTTQSVEVQASVGHTGANRSWSVTATAICADPGTVPGIYLDDNDVETSGTSPQVSATAECGPNDRLLSAGFEFSGATGRIHLTALRLTETGVTVKGREDSGHTTANWDVTPIAICAPLDPTQTTLGSETGDTDSAGSRFERLDCDPGFQVTGAGGSVTPEPGAADYIQLTNVRIHDYTVLSPPPTWAEAHSNEATPSTTANSTLTGYVICADLTP